MVVDAEGGVVAEAVEVEIVSVPVGADEDDSAAAAAAGARGEDAIARGRGAPSVPIETGTADNLRPGRYPRSASSGSGDRFRRSRPDSGKSRVPERLVSPACGKVGGWPPARKGDPPRLGLGVAQACAKPLDFYYAQRSSAAR